MERQEDRHGSHGQFSGERPADRAVADLEEPGEQHPGGGHRETAESRLEPAARDREPPERGAQPEERTHEAHRHQSPEYAEHGVDEQFPGRPEFVGGNREQRLVAQRQAEHQPARDRAQDDGAEHAGVQVADDLFEREQDRGDRGVEGGRDRRRRSDGDQLPALLGIQMQRLSHRGGDPGADLRGRPLASQRDAAPQGEHSAEVLPEGHPERNPAVLRDQRGLGLRNAAAPRPLEPAVHQESGSQGPEDRCGEAGRAERRSVHHDVGQPLGHHDEGHDDAAHQRSDPEVETGEEPGAAQELPRGQRLEDPGERAGPEPAHRIPASRASPATRPNSRPTPTVTAVPIRL